MFKQTVGGQHYSRVQLTAAAQVWDSGAVASNRTLNVPYSGSALVSDSDYYWTVAWTNQAGTTSAPAKATFSTALLLRGGSSGGSADWHGAEWISSRGNGSLNTYRTEFNVAGTPARARLYISGLGYAKTWLNGNLTDTHELGQMRHTPCALDGQMVWYGMVCGGWTRPRRNVC